MLSITGLSKRYNDGQVALENVSLDVKEGEILALLGPNGAGKTTLISAVCGLVVPTAGQVTVGGFDTRSNYRLARSLIGLVPQEIALEPFEKVINTVRFSRGLFGKSPNDDQIEIVLRQLSLWDKKDSKILQLSGGMKRRVLIAKALAHEPRVLFLDEPSAGVDVELRRDMWKLVSDLKSQGVTIILTTHYIEEAEAIADRVGVISKGKLILLEEKKALIIEQLKEITSGAKTTSSGLQYIIEKEGDGNNPSPGQNVSVHYSGYLLDGTKFDSSHDRGEPITFPIGQGRVIKGWDEGISLLKVGGKAKLIIPPDLGYGDRAIGPIPPGSILIFDVELVDIL